MSEDKWAFLKGFVDLANAYEAIGASLSCCDNCNTDYPVEWVELLEGTCPFCGLPHTIEVMPDVSAESAEGGLVDNEPITA